MKIYKLSNQTNLFGAMDKIDVSKAGIHIMQEKGENLIFFIKDLKTPAANILKQDALSIGAELAVPRETISCGCDLVDAILIGTKKQMKILAKKELPQPFGLRELAKELEKFCNPKNYESKIMGIINANDDSFFKDSRFVGDATIEKIEIMVEDGADIIDLGGVSSRPGSQEVCEDEEMARVCPIIDAIYERKLFEKAKFSLDSYRPKALEYALNRGFSIINDITGLENDEVAKICAKHDATVVIMHMKGNPKNMQTNPHYDNVVLEVSDFFAQRIQKAHKFGIKNIILDPGIGFGKSLEHNLLLIKHLEHFKKFGFEILVGASRKSVIDKISPSSIQDRLPGTLALHQKALDCGASILRSHDVKEHKQMLRIWNALRETII